MTGNDSRRDTQHFQFSLRGERFRKSSRVTASIDQQRVGSHQVGIAWYVVVALAAEPSGR